MDTPSFFTVSRRSLFMSLNPIHSAVHCNTLPPAQSRPQLSEADLEVRAVSNKPSPPSLQMRAAIQSGPMLAAQLDLC